MKFSTVILIVAFLAGCSNNDIPKDATKLIIDKNLPDSTFEFIGYYESVGVDSSERINMNADIVEMNQNRRMYQTCKAFFRDDKLIIDFTSGGSIETSRLRLEIADDYYRSYLLVGPNL